MRLIRKRIPDFLILALLFLLPLIMFWQQTLGGRTLIPTENLYQYEPFATYREVVDAPDVPHNHLISDLVLQNFQWKSFIRQNIREREIPLWNPHQFSGIPFMAAGQQSTLYPLSIIYYILPLTVAYGWFTVLNLWLAGGFMYAFMRGLGVGRAGAAVSAVTYQLCGFFIASAVFPMILGGVVWLPLLLLMTEYIIKKQPFFGRPTTIPYVVIGAIGLACNIFAGHVEITIYTLLITAFYAAGRLIYEWMDARAWRESLVSGGWLALMVGLGFGLGAVQFIPLYTVAQDNWRAERTDLRTVLSFAHPTRDLIQYALPNFYGSPAHHSYFDLFAGETKPVDFINARGEQRYHTEWGIKNYVEGALYIGVLPITLALYGLFVHRQTDERSHRRQKVIFALLTLIALTFMFGLPTYAVIYVLPGINQLNSAFRWVYGVTVGVAVLAGFGMDNLIRKSSVITARHFGYMLLAGGLFTLAALILSRVFYDQFQPLVQRVFEGFAKADEGFADASMFYSYQFRNVAILGGMLVASGMVFLWASHQKHNKFPRWSIFAVGVVAIDLMIASWGFNPASDPLLLDFTPPAVQWLLDRQESGEHFRYTTLDDPAAHLPILQPNITMRYRLDDIRGYDSIISAQYVNYMRETAIQPQLDFNRIAPLYVDRIDEVDWDRLNLLNVRYVVTDKDYLLPSDMSSYGRLGVLADFDHVYVDDSVAIWRNNRAFERVTLFTGELGDIPLNQENLEIVGSSAIISDTGREKLVSIDLNSEAQHWLFISETYAPGWRAFIRPAGTDESYEKPLEVFRMWENFQGVALSSTEIADLYADTITDEEDENTAAQLRRMVEDGLYTVRLVYSPASFQVGLFGSVISGAFILFMSGVWVWGWLIGASDDESAGVSRVARNSIAPIILNLFNRGIDFVFAFVMLRILGPEDAGIYYYAIVVFVWFDIFTNFGLDVFLIREVSRQRERSGKYLFNSSTFRLLLMMVCIPLLIGFIIIRQSFVEPELNQEALLAIGLLYIGLAPGSLNKGLTSLFYAYEKAEYPAAVTTVTTINRTVLQLIALLLGYGIVGLAGMSIVVNIITLGILVWSARGMIRFASTERYRIDGSLFKEMRREGWPLMLNHFLATIFFQIDVVILETLRGAAIVGKYSVAYRWLLALNIIPAFFTQALLPVMSRQANENRESLKRTYTLGVKLLLAVALPVAVAFTFLAEPLTLLLGGSQFVPEGAIALQIMIWSIPIGWINSLTQYTLIAVDLQRRITQAFIVAVTFNIVTNFIFIPIYGYQAAAVTTILSEMVLLVPFGLLLETALGRIDWVGMVWRPVIASAVMLGVLLILWSAQPILALIAGGVVYPIVLLGLRPLSSDEMAMLTPLIPARPRVTGGRING